VLAANPIRHRQSVAKTGQRRSLTGQAVLNWAFFLTIPVAARPRGRVEGAKRDPSRRAPTSPTRVEPTTSSSPST
jgi:hypothetical protein